MSQTSYNLNMATARAGLESNIGPQKKRSYVNASKMQVLVTVTSANSTVFTTTINGVTATITSGGSTSATAIATALVAAINTAAPSGVVVTDNGNGTYTITGAVVSVVFTYAFSGAGVQVATVQVAGAQQIPFGCLTVMNPDGQSARLPYQASDVTTGNLLAGPAVINPNSVSSEPVGSTPSGVPTYKQGDAMTVLESGGIAVPVEEAVNAGDTPFVRFAAGAGGTQQGAWRKSADTSTAAQVPNCRYVQGAAAGALAELEFHTP